MRSCEGLLQEGTASTLFSFCKRRRLRRPTSTIERITRGGSTSEAYRQPPKVPPLIQEPSPNRAVKKKKPTHSESHDWIRISWLNSNLTNILITTNYKKTDVTISTHSTRVGIFRTSVHVIFFSSSGVEELVRTAPQNTFEVAGEGLRESYGIGVGRGKLPWISSINSSIHSWLVT